MTQSHLPHHQLLIQPLISLALSLDSSLQYARKRTAPSEGNAHATASAIRCSNQRHCARNDRRQKKGGLGLLCACWELQLGIRWWYGNSQHNLISKAEVELEVAEAGEGTRALWITPLDWRCPSLPRWPLCSWICLEFI